jgi:hypothetical protein
VSARQDGAAVASGTVGGAWSCQDFHIPYAENLEALRLTGSTDVSTMLLDLPSRRRRVDPSADPALMGT